MWITALCMFKKLCLLLLLLLAGSLVPKFHFQLTKKTRERSQKRLDNLEDGLTALAQLYAFHSDRAHSFNQWQHTLHPNFLIKLNKSSIWSLKLILEYKHTYTQFVRVDKEASIFSIGGYCAYSLTSSDSDAFFSCFCSCLSQIQYKIKCLGNWVYAKLPLRLHIYFPNIFLIWNDYNNLKVI